MKTTDLKQMIKEEMKVEFKLKDGSQFQTTMKTHYQVDDFQAGMLIEAIVNDNTYHITKDEAYEIIEVYEFENGDPSIRFTNDNGNGESKLVNHPEYPFNKYFRIL